MKRIVPLFILTSLLLLAGSPGLCKVIRVKPTGIDLNDGSSWGLAKKTLANALVTSVSGDEIWVAAGTYSENVTLKNGVGLYAGFAAAESSRDERDWRSNQTIIDGGNTGSVITSPMNLTASARVDGFAITKGSGTVRAVSGQTQRLGGGVFCTNSSPVITNCTITGNSVTNNGGAIYLENSSAAISNSVISDNTAGWNGPGIHCESSSPAIHNNFIAKNTVNGTTFGGTQGGGIFCGASSSPTITNNTIVMNQTSSSAQLSGGGICCASGSSPAIVNNIIESNSSGIFSAGNPTLRYNCVHGQGLFDYINVQPGNGDISQDPAFIDMASGNYHLQAGSQCRDRGDDTAAGTGWLDIDGQVRKYGVHVDLGGDEFWPPPTVTITSPTSDPNYTATGSPLVLMGTASDGVASVVWSNDRGGSGKCAGTTSWVGSGVALQPGLNVITVTARDAAGFASADTLNVTYNTGAVNVIFVKPLGNDANTGASWDLAKQTIQAGINTAKSGEEVWVAAGTYLENATLKDGVAVYGGFAVGDGSREARRISRNLTIIDGRRLDNTVKALTGTTNTTRIDGFVIRNGSGGAGGGVFCENSQAIIANNVITACEGGVFCRFGAVTVANNLIYSNGVLGGGGGGISLYSCARDTTIVSNTIAGNTASLDGGIYLNNCAGKLQIANNIVAFNSSGIGVFSGFLPTLSHNDVYGNTAYDYAGITAGTTDLQLDPLFIDRATANYHLRTTPTPSPCSNAGSNSALGLTTYDIDGQGRINAGVVDIGADEVWPAAAVSITSPTSDPGYLTTTPTVDIGGTASEGVLRVTWASDRGGSGVCSGATLWSASGIGLLLGANVITVTADAGVTTASAALTVYYDAAPPTIQIASPTTDPTYTSPTALLNIAGNATDDTGVTLVTWTNSLGGSGTCTGAAFWSASGIALRPGSNLISVTAKDASGKTAVDRLTVTYIDTTPPVIAIASPTANPAYPTKLDKITLGGTASDDSAIDSVTWTSDRGGTGTCTGTANWTAADIPLLVGANVITVTARDSAGNTATDVITVTYDNVAPSVAITSPTLNPTYPTNIPRVDLAGSASDDTGVVSVAWLNDTGGSGLCSGTTSWSVSGIVLKPGQNVITVTASDAAGNVTTDVLTVTFTDVTAPACTITAPTADPTYSTTNAKLAIGGAASDDAGVASVAWSNSRGGSGACTGTASWSASGIQLQPGLNIITVTATDTSGNTGFDMLNVTFTDTTPPVVTITKPAGTGVVRSCATVNLSGTASDDVAVTRVYWWNDRGGSEDSTGTTAWSAAAVALQPGPNVITVVATDSSNNTGAASVTVMYTSVSPGDAWKGLSMVSIPLVPDETDPKNVVGFYQNSWHTFRPELNAYASYPDRLTWLDPVEMTPMRGFWAYFAATPAAPCGTALPQDQAVSIHLVPGWNLIGQPFLSAVKWDLDAIQVEPVGENPRSMRNAGDVVGAYAWGWDNIAGSYYLVYDPSIISGVVDRLDPWRAYWIKAKRECDVILPPP